MKLNCLICQQSLAPPSEFYRDQPGAAAIVWINCPGCGNYKITSRAENILNGFIKQNLLTIEYQMLLKAWIKCNTREQITPRILHSLLPDLVQRYERMTQHGLAREIEGYLE